MNATNATSDSTASYTDKTQVFFSGSSC